MACPGRPGPDRVPAAAADATFPIDMASRSDERGCRSRAAVYDPVRSRSSVDRQRHLRLGLRASVSSAVETGGHALQVMLDGGDGREPPPSLISCTAPASIRIQPTTAQRRWSSTQKVPERDRRRSATQSPTSIVFRLTTFNVGGPGQPWLSIGHYLGDGSTGDDRADTGATGGPVTVTSPPASHSRHVQAQPRGARTHGAGAALLPHLVRPYGRGTAI